MGIKVPFIFPIDFLKSSGRLENNDFELPK